MGHYTAIAFSTVVMVIAGVHVYWACGGLWPGKNERDLAETVVGPTPGGRMPGAAPCIAVATALFVAALLPWFARSVLPAPIPHWWVDLATWSTASVFTLRGIGGFFERQLRPRIVGLAYDRLNRVFYSPLCIALAGLIMASVSL